MLWSPGSKGKGAEGGGSASLDGGSGSNSGGNGEDLSALAKKFKERYGEEVASDDGDDAMVVGGDALDTPVRKRGLNGGASPRTPAEEVAQSMSPAKLAAEIQKARARAREQRFGGGGGGGGKPVAAPRGAPAARIPLDHAASVGQKRNGAGSAASASSLPQEVPGGKGSVPAAVAAAAARKAPRLANTTGGGGPSASTSSTSATAVAGSGGPAPRVTPATVSPLTTTSRASVRRTAAPASSTGSAKAPVVVRADTGEVDTSAASKAERTAAVTAPEAIPMDEAHAASTTSAPAPKRPAPDGGDVVVIEPPSKKIMPPPSKASPPPSSSRPAGVGGGKVHTLRLRLRTEAAAEAKQPERVVPPETDVAGSGGGGMEEFKGFDPPNPRPDGGVEECKGFDPPNLPPASKPRQQNAPPAASPPTTAESATSTTPSGTSTAAPVATPAPAAGGGATAPNSAAKRSSTGADGAAAPSSSALAREGSWGPSFGIFGATADRSTETRPVPATPAPSPVAGAPPPNPWILSPEAPTFARNQGRPLAPSFRKPSPAAGGGSGGASGGARTAAGNGEVGSAGRAAASERDDAAAVTRPATPGGGSNSSSRGGLVGRGTSPASKAPAGGSPRQTSTPTPSAALAVGGGAQDKVAAGPAVQAQAGNSAVPGSNPDAPRVARQGAAGVSPPAAAAAGARAGSAAAGGVAAAAGAEEEAAAPGGQLLLGVHLSGSAGQLLARLARERVESRDYERKLTLALLDL